MEQQEKTNAPKRTLGRFLAMSIIIATVVGLGTAAWWFYPRQKEFFTDADTIKQPVAAAIVRDILWQPPTELSEIINTSEQDYEPRLSWDGLTLYFVRGKAGENADIYVSRRTPNGWTEAAPLTEINTEFDELGPEPSPDGTAIYFYTDRPGGRGGYDLWVARRRTDGTTGYGEPVNLGPRVNSEFNDYGAALTPDGTTLYFSSNRPQTSDVDRPDPHAWPATIREDLFRRTYDLYQVTLTDAGMSEAQPVVILNTPHNEGSPAVSPFGDFLYFTSDRPVGSGGFDLYRARRLRGMHEPPHNLGVTVNTSGNELDPGLGLGGYALYFSSDRPVDDAPPGVKPDYNLYYTTSREVFSEFDALHRQGLDWAMIWSKVGPNLLWALLALLLLLLLLALLRDMRHKKMSLLAKCLLASMMAHLLLLLFFNVWEVTAALAGEFNRRGGTKVALTSPVRGRDIASQLFGKLTEIDAPKPQQIVVERATVIEHATQEVEAAALGVSRAVIQPMRSALIETNAQEATLPIQTKPIANQQDERIAPSSLVELAMPGTSKLPVVDEPQPAPDTQELARDDRSPTRAANTPVQADSTEQVALAPKTTETDRMPVLLMSLVGPEKVREASSAPVHLDVSDATHVSVELPDSVQVDLPQLTQRQSEEATEAKLQVFASDVPSNQRFVNEPLEVDFPTMAAIVPERMAEQTHDSDRVDQSLAATDLVTAREMHVESPAAPTTQQSVSDLSLPPMQMVSLDGLEESKSPLLQERQASVVPVVADVHRRRNEISSGSRLVEADVFELKPATKDFQKSRKSLAVSVTDQAHDVEAVVNARLDVSRVPVSVPPVPPLDLSLDAFEETTSAKYEENPRTLQPVVPGNSRRSASSLMAKNEPRDNPELVDVKPARDVLRLSAKTSLADATRRIDEWTPTLNPFDPTLPSEHTPAPSDLSNELALPTEVAPLTNPYLHRSPDVRNDVLKRMGGSDETERAVAAALRWLADHQSKDGRWDADGFDDECGQCGGETDVAADVALTGLSLLCFLGADHTQLSDGPYQENVRRGIEWLKQVQKGDGDLRGEETMYSHGIATIALSEAFGMTKDTHLKAPVQRAIEFIEDALNTGSGGWRYDPRQAGDTSVLGWQVMALKSAQLNGIPVSSGALDAARKWMRRVRHPSKRGRYGYQRGRQYTHAMTAEGMFVLQLLGVDRNDRQMKASAKFLSSHVPSPRDNPNTYYWYYATLAMFQNQGPKWERWNDALMETILPTQRKDGRPAGSWDPVGEWAETGGRVYQTALCTLMLEVYYRYLPLYTLDDPARMQESQVVDAIGAVRGVVTDSDSGEPVSGAVIRLDVPDRPTITARTRRDGSYRLRVPEVPDFFALSATHEGFLPTTLNVPKSRLRGTVLDVDFALSPLSEGTVAVEMEPEVHHLGDNAFSGAINSQFQKEAEGDYYVVTFELIAQQLPPHFNNASIRMLAKGVQRPHRIVVNGQLLEDHLDDAPSDGSFGDFEADLNMAWLHEGVNTLEIFATSFGSDVDDFEFVNMQIHLTP